MQKFKVLTGESGFQGSLDALMDNDRTVLSQSSGNNFPTGDLSVGMSCYRSDTGVEYILDKEKKWRKNALTGGIESIINEKLMFISNVVYENSLESCGWHGYLVLPTEDNIIIQWGSVAPYDAIHMMFIGHEKSPTGKAGYFRRINGVIFPIPYIDTPSVITNDPFKSGSYGSSIISSDYEKAEMVVTPNWAGFDYDLMIRTESDNYNDYVGSSDWRAGYLKQACPENYNQKLMGCSLAWIAIGKFDYEKYVSVLAAEANSKGGVR